MKLLTLTKLRMFQNEIDEVLRGDGKRKKPQSPSLIPSRRPAGKSAPGPGSTGQPSTLKASAPPQRPEPAEREPLVPPTASGITDGGRSPSRETNPSVVGQRLEHKSSGHPDRDGARVTDTHKNRNNVEEFERRKAAICFGSDDSGKDLETTADLPKSNSSSKAFEFLEDSAFAENLYATVISPLEKRRLKQSESACEQISDPDRQKGRLKQGESARRHKNSRTEQTSKEKPHSEEASVCAIPFDDGAGSESLLSSVTNFPEPRVTQTGNKDVLLEILLKGKGSHVNQTTTDASSDLHHMLDTDRRGLLLGRGSSDSPKTLTKQHAQTMPKSLVQQHRPQQQPNTPPPPPKRTSSIRKSHKGQKHAPGPIQNTKTLSSLETLKQRLQDNRQHSKYQSEREDHKQSKQIAQLQQQQQHQQQPQQLKRSDWGHHKNSLNTYNIQNISSNQIVSKSNITDPQHSESVQHSHGKKLTFPHHALPQTLSQHPGLQREPPHSDSPHAELSDTERAHRERAARLMQIYEDVKNISRPGAETASQPHTAPQASNHHKQGLTKRSRQQLPHRHHHDERQRNAPHQENQDQQRHQKHQHLQPVDGNTQCRARLMSRQKAQSQKITQNERRSKQYPKSQANHEPERQLSLQTQTQFRILQEKASEPLDQPLDKDNLDAFGLHSSHTQPQHSPHTHSQSGYHTMSRALSDHATDSLKPSPILKPPRRFSDSQAYREPKGLSRKEQYSPGLEATEDQTLHGTADTSISTATYFDASMAGRQVESDSAPSLYSPPPPLCSPSCGRRLSDTALYSSQYSDYDELTSSMEEAMIVTPPPEFMNDPADPIPEREINSNILTTVTTSTRTSASTKTTETSSGASGGDIPTLATPTPSSTKSESKPSGDLVRIGNLPRKVTRDSAAVSSVISPDPTKPLRSSEQSDSEGHNPIGRYPPSWGPGVQSSQGEVAQQAQSPRRRSVPFPSDRAEIPDTQVDYQKRARNLDLTEHKRVRTMYLSLFFIVMFSLSASLCFSRSHRICLLLVSVRLSMAVWFMFFGLFLVPSVSLIVFGLCVSLPFLSPIPLTLGIC